ncbi:MAG: tRNA (adenosine(37)-N6)-dimethylallyltransferase MiaA, partial [Candidatus Omnitrophica bacterium]|nr:tRNA (adenosine(37)-N6)-dimethylallyltransferase MiaA [Candidatus Omnitrophota bacterium]
VDRMFDDGLVDEVKNLVGKKLSITAAKALGVKEVSAYLSGKIDLDTAKEELKKNTRRYAKRQLTWFRNTGGVEWIDAARSARDVARDISGRC